MRTLPAIALLLLVAACNSSKKKETCIYNNVHIPCSEMPSNNPVRDGDRITHTGVAAAAIVRSAIEVDELRREFVVLEDDVSSTSARDDAGNTVECQARLRAGDRFRYFETARSLRLTNSEGSITFSPEDGASGLEGIYTAVDGQDTLRFEFQGHRLLIVTATCRL